MSAAKSFSCFSRSRTWQRRNAGRHKTFRTSHREVKEFVRRHGLKAGDSVEIVRVARYEYRVRPAEAK